MANPFEAALRGAEMEKLSFLIGTWRAEDRYEKSSVNPDGGVGSGLYRITIGPGGFSVLTDYRYKAPHGSSSGHQALSWQARQDCYRGFTVSSTVPGCIELMGNWEGSIFVLSGVFDFHDREIAFRQEFSDVAGRMFTVRQYNCATGGPLELFGTTRFTPAGSFRRRQS